MRTIQPPIESDFARNTPPYKKPTNSDKRALALAIATVIAFLLVTGGFILVLFLYFAPSIGNTAREKDINSISKTITEKLIANHQALPVNPIQSKAVLNDIEYEYYTNIWVIYWNGRPVNTDTTFFQEDLAVGQRPPVHLLADIKERDNIYIWSAAKCDQDNLPVGVTEQYSFAIHFAKELQAEPICYTIK